jgi:hypothetical protein
MHMAPNLSLGRYALGPSGHPYGDGLASQGQMPNLQLGRYLLAIPLYAMPTKSSNTNRKVTNGNQDLTVTDAALVP